MYLTPLIVLTGTMFGFEFLMWAFLIVADMFVCLVNYLLHGNGN